MKKTDNKILFPIDFQKQSEIAIEYSCYFAKATGSEVVLLHILEEESLIEKMFTSENQRELYKNEAIRMLNEAAEKLRKQDCKVSTILEKGKVYHKIVDIAKQINPKFILIGKSQEPSFTRNLIGSNVQHLIKLTTYPIITIRGDITVSSYKKLDREIIVPIDFTKEYKEQLTAAIAFAKYLKSKIKLITVLTEDSKGIELNIITKINAAKKVVENAKINCTTKIIKEFQKSVVKSILEYAEKEESHLIVIMTHDEISTLDYFVGHNAIEIIDRSTIPVLSVLPSSESESVFNNFIDPFLIMES